MDAQTHAEFALWICNRWLVIRTQALSACVAGSLAVAVSLSPLAVAPAPALAADEAGGGLVGFARGYASVRLASARRAGAGWQWRSADAAVERARGREWPVQGRE